ncbi:MAG: esterase family protein [Clostridia bacterium]|nr:esterase family protein [Clostridia bacterium]
MAVNQINFYSEALGKYTCANVILPLPKHAGSARKPLPALILLHGMGDDFSSWMRRTAVERYALQAGLAVIMPDGALSCYENMAHGQNYRDFIAEELPLVMRGCFPLSGEREENFIAGCSMGGCGALKLGLRYPEKWSAIGAFSGAHLEYRPPSPRNQAMIHNSFGDGLIDADMQIEKNAANPDKPPLKIWQACGDGDVLKDTVLESRAFLEQQPGIDYHFEMLPGQHDWALWDEMIRRFIVDLKLPEPEVRLL